jgi:Membrane binding/Beta/Gamma crystallin
VEKNGDAGMSDNEACFFTEYKFEGERHCYPLGANENLWPGALNDKFKSVKVGRVVKVLAWQHANATGAYREWSVDEEDITDIGGLSRFAVVRDTTLPIAVRFEDGMGGPARRYSLQMNSHDVGEVKVMSGDSEFGLVGIIPADGPPVTTAIYVRDESSGEYIATGSIYFGWNADTKAIDVVDETHLPKKLGYQRVDRNRFVFTLTEA